VTSSLRGDRPPSVSWVRAFLSLSLSLFPYLRFPLPLFFRYSTERVACCTEGSIGIPRKVEILPQFPATRHDGSDWRERIEISDRVQGPVLDLRCRGSWNDQGRLRAALSKRAERYRATVPVSLDSTPRVPVVFVCWNGTSAARSADTLDTRAASALLVGSHPINPL